MTVLDVEGIYTYIHTYVRTNKYIEMFLHSYIHKYLCICTYLHTYIHIYLQIHIWYSTVLACMRIVDSRSYLFSLRPGTDHDGRRGADLSGYLAEM